MEQITLPAIELQIAQEYFSKMSPEIERQISKYPENIFTSQEIFTILRRLGGFDGLISRLQSSLKISAQERKTLLRNYQYPFFNYLKQKQATYDIKLLADGRFQKQISSFL